MIAHLGSITCVFFLVVAEQDPGVTQSAEPGSAPRISDPYMPAYSSGHRYWSRTAPSPPPHHPESEFGYRNPGGVGRVAEFYPPNNKFENQGRNPVAAARFGSGSPDLSRSAQMQAQQIGIQKTNSLNNQIDAFARPFGGFGFGMGMGGGFPY